MAHDPISGASEVKSQGNDALPMRKYGIKSTKILHSVSGEAKSGEMLAVMGASGSGKTTLLNILSGRLPPTSGKITLNGRSFTKAMKRNLAYVLQADIFLPRLTLWETLYFSAMVHMPDTVPKSDKLARINDIVRSLDLTKCLQTVIGDEFTRGLSGGEKKRANIACELLADPEILLVDEPTSGLDSNTALRMMEMLWKLVHSSNTIMITTIHQPSSHIFHMFSSLLLLVDGHTAYFGDGKKAIDYFADLGFCCEENYNPADFLCMYKPKIYNKLMRSEVSVVNKIILSAERKGASHSPEELREAIDRSPRADSSNMEMQAVTDIRLEIEQNVGENAFAKNQEEDDVESKRKWRTSFWTQFRTLTWRNLRQSKRRLFNLHGAIHTFLIGFFAGVMYYQIDRSLNTFRDRMGVIFFGVVYMGFGMMEIAVAGFSEDRDVVNKDRNSNMYRLSAYYVAKIVSELPHVFVTPFFFFTYVYWISSLGDVTGFFVFLGMNFLSCLLAQSMGHMIGASVTNARAGIMSANTYMIISALLGGFFITHFPSWLEWSRYLAISHYPFAVMVTVILGDQPISRCNISIPEDSPCSTSMTNVTEVEYLLQDVGIQLPVYCYVAMMCLLTVLFILAGYIFLRIRGPKV